MKHSTPIVLALLTLTVLLAGCAQQDEVIGYGPASLFFSNDGSEPIDVRVTWVGSGGGWVARDFTVYVDGQVELRLSDRLEYYVELASDGSGFYATMGKSSDEAEPHTQVITLDDGIPCDPPKGARRGE